MKFKEIIKNIYWVDFSTQEKLCKTALRFQEYYESPKFKGKYFTLEEYKEWCIEQHGKFTYYSDWSGFGFPSWAIKPFFTGCFSPLSELEEEFLSSIIYYTKGEDKKFYIIGTYSGDGSILKHEIAHGLYHLNDDYKINICKLVLGSSIDLEPLTNHLLQDYHVDSLMDEINAYIMFNSRKLEKNGIDMEPYTKLKKQLLELYNDTCFLINKMEII